MDSLLFSLCHANNAKPNCPPFSLSTCIYFVLLPSPLHLSPPCTVSLLGVGLSPSPHHSQLLEPIILCSSQVLFSSGGQRRTEIWIYYLRQQRHTFICSFFPSLTCPFVVSSTKVSPDSTNEGLVVYNKPTGLRVTHTSSGLVCFCSGMLRVEPCVPSPQPRLSAVFRA